MSIKKSEEYWKNKLSPDEYRILREGETEPAFAGNLLHNKKTGLYSCKACGKILFSSETKYDSDSGWPSFFDVISEENLELKEDLSHGMRRVEVKCSNCGSHLGHLFSDGPGPTGNRYCINSAALEFEE